MDSRSEDRTQGSRQPGGASRTRRDVRRVDVVDITEHGKLPPQAVDIEEAVLGALMLEQNALSAVIDILRPEVFYKEAHQKIFSAVSRLFGKSEPIDLLTVSNELRSYGDLEVVGGAYYISQLTNRVASAANIEFHARILLEKYIQRQLIFVSSNTIRDAYEDSTDVFDLLDKAESELFNISQSNLKRQSIGMQVLLRQAVEQIEEARKHDSHIIGIPSGFTGLDRITGGWQRSDLIILAARPGMGKTAFVLNMARNIAVEFKRAVAVFSLEMSSLQLVTRLISSETELSSEKLRRGDLQEYEWEQLNTKIRALTEAKLFIDDTPALSIFDLRAKCRRLVQQHKVEMVIVDYLQLMQASVDTKGNREQEISSISRALKALAKELNIPVICLSQLNRSVETRTGTKRPVLSDLRESGAIEQDADMVLFIYRPEYYKINEDEKGQSVKGLAELIIAKHRNGPLADIKLKFIDRIAKFVDAEFNMDDSFLSETIGSGSFTLSSRMNHDSDLPVDDGVPF
jgi:replicative DNA helicase